MNNEVCIDYNYVHERHTAIHARLENWRRWVIVRPHGWQVAPMFRMYQSKARQWEASPRIGTPVDTLDAVLVEKAIYALPEKHREAVRWWYVYRRNPAAMARSLGVSKQGLADLVEAGRTMLNNRLQK